jgi:hypothetical protein
MSGPSPAPSLHRVGADELGRGGLASRLERGEVLVFAQGTLPLPPEDDLVFLRKELGELITLKNISYHPEDGHLSGIKNDPPRKARTRSILKSHNQSVQALLSRALPEYGGDWRVEKVNFRPIQEQGRELKPRQSNERIHTDAFASGATHGRRILRFFTNIHPTEPRVWKSAGLFPEIAREFGPSVGLDKVRLEPGLANRAFSGALRAISKIGLPQAILADTSPYDRAMLRLHNRLKDDLEFQADESRQVRMTFQPFESWAVYTDTVSHAVISGQHALVNTFYVSLAKCAEPDLAPWRILERRLA